MDFSVWIKAARPRTLPLILGSISLGLFFAYKSQTFDWWVGITTLLTATLLQILANFANDLGDSENGADQFRQHAEARQVATGKISKSLMKKAVVFIAVTALVSGLIMIELSFGLLTIYGLIFLLLGLSAIAAAVFYTGGKKPYGYFALGDVASFIFFGPVAVAGSYFLQSGSFNWQVMFPSVIAGLWSVAVLNVNNIRDIESDLKAKKRTIANLLGDIKARHYQMTLIWSTVLVSLVWVLLLGGAPQRFLFLLVLPQLWRYSNIFYQTPQTSLDPMLKFTALTALVYMLLIDISTLFINI